MSQHSTNPLSNEAAAAAASFQSSVNNVLLHDSNSALFSPTSSNNVNNNNRAGGRRVVASSEESPTTTSPSMQEVSQSAYSPTNVGSPGNTAVIATSALSADQSSAVFDNTSSSSRHQQQHQQHKPVEETGEEETDAERVARIRSEQKQRIQQHRQERKEEETHAEEEQKKQQMLLSNKKETKEERQRQRAARKEAAAATNMMFAVDHMRRYKTFYAFITCILPVVACMFLCLALTTNDWFWIPNFEYKRDGAWLANFFNVPDHSYVGLNPIMKNSTCISLFASDATNEVGGTQQYLFGCKDLGDAVSSSSYLSSALVVAIFCCVALSVHELAAYGPFGGSKNFARVSWILSLVAISINLLLVATWWFITNVHFCDSLNLFERGFEFSWSFYICVGLLFFLFVDCVLTGKAISRTSRGPPSMAVFFRTILLCISCLNVLSQSWLAHEGIDGAPLFITGFGEACLSWQAEFPCPVLNLYGDLLIVAASISITVAIACVFFVSSRAVDHRGATLYWSSGLGVALSLCCVGIGIGIFAALSVDGKSCSQNSFESLSKTGFMLGRGSWIMLPTLCCAVLFTVLNTVYKCSCCVPKIEIWITQKPKGGGTSASSVTGVTVSAAAASSAAVSPTSRASHDTSAVDLSAVHAESLDPNATMHMGSSPRAGRVREGQKKDDGEEKTSYGGIHHQKNRHLKHQRRASDGTMLIPKIYQRNLYRYFYYEGLTDPRTASILAREYGDATQEESGEDFESEDSYSDESSNSGSNHSDVEEQGEFTHSQQNVVDSRNSASASAAVSASTTTAVTVAQRQQLKQQQQSEQQGEESEEQDAVNRAALMMNRREERLSFIHRQQNDSGVREQNRSPLAMTDPFGNNNNNNNETESKKDR